MKKLSSEYLSLSLFACLALIFAAGCQSNGKGTTAASKTKSGEIPLTESGEPGFITVQHILIGFKGSVRDKPIARTKEEAEAFANKLLKQAQAGEDFDALVKKHTDDSHPGIYQMANDGFPGDMTPTNPADKIFPRRKMVPAFGNVGFPLKVGEIGMSQYDPSGSPFGWHIVKRIK